MAYDEDEQIDRLKQWWSENWKALAGGLAIGISGIVGWNAWQAHGEQKAEAASALFTQVIAATDAGDLPAAQSAREALTSDYSGTPYAVAGSLQLAAAHVQQGDLDAAAEALQWAREHAGDPAMGRLAAIRLARVRWAQDDAEAGLSLLGSNDTGDYRAVSEELRGDILLDQGERRAAFEAYSAAMTVAPGESRPLLQQKLDNLADAAPADAEPAETAPTDDMASGASDA